MGFDLYLLVFSCRICVHEFEGEPLSEDGKCLVQGCNPRLRCELSSEKLVGSKLDESSDNLISLGRWEFSSSYALGCKPEKAKKLVGSDRSKGHTEDAPSVLGKYGQHP